MPVNLEFNDGFRLTRMLFLQLEQGAYMENIVTFAREFGDEIRENLRKHILARDLGWPSLSKTTVARKGQDAPYIETGFYLQNIKVEVDKPTRFDVTLSVFPEGTHPTGFKLQDIAEILEIGAPGRNPPLPARPLWRPVKNEMWNYSTFRKMNTFELLTP